MVSAAIPVICRICGWETGNGEDIHQQPTEYTAVFPDTSLATEGNTAYCQSDPDLSTDMAFLSYMVCRKLPQSDPWPRVWVCQVRRSETGKRETEGCRRFKEQDPVAEHSDEHRYTQDRTEQQRDCDRVLKSTKTESSVRKVFIPETVALMLKEHKATQEDLKDLVGSEYPGKYGVIRHRGFPWKYDEPGNDPEGIR